MVKHLDKPLKKKGLKIKCQCFHTTQNCFFVIKYSLKDILCRAEVTVNTNSHSSEIKRWFWNDILRKKEKKEKAANTNSNFKEILKEGRSTSLCRKMKK